METPIEQVIALFDIQPIIDFFVASATVIIAFVLAKKAYSMVLGLIYRESPDGMTSISDDEFYETIRQELRDEGLSSSEIKQRMKDMGL